MHPQVVINMELMEVAILLAFQITAKSHFLRQLVAVIVVGLALVLVVKLECGLIVLETIILHQEVVLFMLIAEEKGLQLLSNKTVGRLAVVVEDVEKQVAAIVPMATELALTAIMAMQHVQILITQASLMILEIMDMVRVHLFIRMIHLLVGK